MTYIENVFLCMLAPLLVAGICIGRRQLKTFVFCFAGMGACLFSAYLNTFLAIWYQANSFTATVEIAPVVEEVVKLLPLLFYLLVFDFLISFFKIEQFKVILSNPGEYVDKIKLLIMKYLH